MDSEVHWSVWLISGLLLGTISGFGSNVMLGILVGVSVLAAPFVIFMKAGATFLPFALFYGGLMASSSFFYRRRNTEHGRKLREEIAEKRKRMGL